MRLNGNYLFIFQNNDDLNLFTERGFTNKKFSIVIPGNGINTNQFPFFQEIICSNLFSYLLQSY
jgi:hypothetical protein